MKVHKETIEVLIELYTRGRQVFEDEYNIAEDGEDVLEAAALDYMMCPERFEFCRLVDNLDEEVCHELIALMWMGSDREDLSSQDFKALKEDAASRAHPGNYLFGIPTLPEFWKNGREML